MRQPILRLLLPPIPVATNLGVQLLQVRRLAGLLHLPQPPGLLILELSSHIVDGFCVEVLELFEGAPVLLDLLFLVELLVEPVLLLQLLQAFAVAVGYR